MGLPSDILNEIQGYLDLKADEIARKYDLLRSQWDNLGITSVISADKVLNVVQQQPLSEEDAVYDEVFSQIYAYGQGTDRRSKFKDEICTFCSKKGHTENVCFTKRDDDKLSKLTEKCSSSMAEVLSKSQAESMKSILTKLESIYLKVNK